MQESSRVDDYLKCQFSDIALLLQLVLQKNSVWLINNKQYQLSKQEKNLLNGLIEKRKSGVPFAYLSGKQGFYHLNFKVTTDTLIPRPETEILIDIALDLCKNKPCNLLDLGTGSGNIAISLADKNPDWQVSATDFSENALAVAKQNATSKINFYQGDWFAAVPNQTFDLIISNPPYIAENDAHLADLKHEPIEALSAGKDGLEAIKIIIKQAPLHLNKQGFLLLEHGYDQRKAIIEMLKAKFTSIKTFNDYNHQNRAILAQLKT
ncbi:MAG: peptide chain release factor N(5)-glutamine methyltransferase [Candidatus Thioglobus sp.]|nr:MAG: peptide chain release factor N(5)-glutamine methyltransferase [Candidatus Thioglobus sp.]